jgi:hypothetical protein
MESRESEPFEPTTYLGLWSAAGISEVCELLRSLDARFYRVASRYPEDDLRNWCAWDPSAADPYVGYDLWVHSNDLEKVGTRIVDRFPERQFGAA